MFKNERIGDVGSGSYPNFYNEIETKKYRDTVLSSIENFIKNPAIVRGHIVIPTGGGKSFTAALACIKNYKPNEVLFITSKHVILKNIFGISTPDKFGHLHNYNDWLPIIGDSMCVNDSEQSLFLYNTIKNRYEDRTLDSILKERKIIIFDEDTYSHTDSNFKVLDYISRNYPKIKMLGVGLFDYRPMDGVSLTDFFDYCVYSTNLPTMQKRGILPKINYINAVQSSEVIYESCKDKINPKTGKPYTLDYCRKLINFNGIGQQNLNMLNDVLSKIAIRDNWLSRGRCVHMMSVSPNIKTIDMHKKKMKEILMDVFSLCDSDIEFLDYHSYMQDSDRERSLVNFNKNTGAKFKILCGVSAFSEGLHTEVFVDAMLCHRNAKAVYFISQLVGRLEHQCFERRPYFIDVACDSESAENSISRVKELSDRLSSNYRYDNYDDLNMFDFQFDINFNENKCNYFLPQDRLKLMSILRNRQGLINSDNLISRLLMYFPNVDENVLCDEIINLM